MWILFLIIFDEGGSSGRLQKNITTVEFTSKAACIEAVKVSASRKNRSFYDAWCVKK